MPHMQPSVALSSQTGPVYSLGRSQARDHGLWPVAVQPHEAPLCRLNSPHLRSPRKYFTITYLPYLVIRKENLLHTYSLTLDKHSSYWL